MTHGVRYASELAYQQFIQHDLPNNEFFGEEVREKLIYYPSVTREGYATQGRLTNAMSTGKLFTDTGLPQADPKHDRFMICGSPSMLDETSAVLNSFGMKISPRMGDPGDYLIERAFVEKWTFRFNHAL